MKHIKTRISYIKENHNNITTGHYLILEPKKKWFENIINTRRC